MTLFDSIAFLKVLKAKMQVFIPLDVPKIEERLIAEPVMVGILSSLFKYILTFDEKGLIGKEFKANAKAVADHLTALSDEEVSSLQKQIERSKVSYLLEDNSQLLQQWKCRNSNWIQHTHNPKEHGENQKRQN